MRTVPQQIQGATYAMALLAFLSDIALQLIEHYIWLHVRRFEST